MEKAQQWARVKELFGSALEMEPSQRFAFLLAACGDDEALRAEVESLLEAHENPDFLLDNAWHETLSMDMGAPRSIGPFQLVKKLGEGGMGQVWLADQTSPVRRQVAVKFLRSGLVDAALLQRFKAERQSLAIMDHPAIAKVFEAGTTEDGQPYLVMEYVPGQPITKYCDDHKLSVRQRLEILIKVCEGVQHAHQKAIIHRDLKPSNILVTEVDGVPQPRIIDFGLAKGTASGANDRTIVLTQAGGFIGTPGYMSPEQAESGFQDIDTRTDVYSLGVVLYVLLTGCLPFETRDKPMTEVLRQLREDDPARPSTKVVKAAEPSRPAAALRGTEPRQLVHLLRGDLDWIVLKALEKDRNRRYGTPAELAADLRNYLHNEPVIARPASAGYRLRKYVRRHRLAVSVASGLILLLAVFSLVQTAQLRRITRERDRADRVTAFMTGMFRVSNPTEAKGNSITAREILDKASVDINQGLAQDPELQAQMMTVMGRVYGSLGLYGRGESLLRSAVEIERRSAGDHDSKTLHAVDGLTWILGRQGKWQEAAELARHSFDTRRKLLGLDNADTAQSMAYLAWSLAGLGKLTEVESLQRQTLDIRRRVLGPEHRDTLVSMTDLAATLERADRLAEAEKMQRQTMQIQLRVLGPDDPDTLTSIDDLGWTLLRQGRYSESEPLFVDAYERKKRVQGPEHPLTVLALSHLSYLKGLQQRWNEAEALEQIQVDLQTRILGPNNPNTANSLYNLACFKSRLGKPEEAIRVLKAAMDSNPSVVTNHLLTTDDDLESLRGNPRFEALVARTSPASDPPLPPSIGPVTGQPAQVRPTNRSIKAAK